MKLRTYSILMALGLAVYATSAADKASILIVTGVDYPAHLWRETGPTLKRILEADPRLDVRLVEDPHFLDSAALTNYAAVLLHFQTWEVPGPGAAARENLRRYVANGGGLMSVHFACGAWHGEWPEFQNVVGRVWHGSGPGKPQHDARGPFKVRIVDQSHPITKGLSDFETDDELYTCLIGEPKIQVLYAATSCVDQQEYPMGFVVSESKGRIFHSSLGHDVAALRSAGTRELYRRAAAWAAGLSPGGK